MLIKKFKRKIETLRGEPEHVRLRFATIATAASGVLLVLIWATVLLPIQLRFSRPDTPGSEPVRDVLRTVSQGTPVPTASAQPQRVGGARQIGPPSSTPLFTSLPAATPVPTISPSPSPSTDPPTLPVSIPGE